MTDPRLNPSDLKDLLVVRTLPHDCTAGHVAVPEHARGFDPRREERNGVLFQVDPGSRWTLKVLRSRPTRHFQYLLVRCKCGKTFGHRGDRRTIVCFTCGRTDDLRLVLQRQRRLKASAKANGNANGKANGKADHATAGHPAKRRPVKRRNLTAPAASRRARVAR